MTIGLLFSGQGRQHAGTMPWLEQTDEAADTLRMLGDYLGPAWRERMDDPDWAFRNANAQLLLTGLGIAAWQSLQARLPAPEVVAGYSVGELPALFAAGVYDAETALELAHQRAQAMDRSAEGRRMGLMAVQGADPDEVQRLCCRHGLALAIRLAVDSAVVGGPEAALMTAAQELDEKGHRTQRLAVHVASHTPWMSSATTAFAERLAAIPLRAPGPVVVCNATGASTRSPAEIAHNLSKQISSPVLWDACCESVEERGVTCVLEIGPGTALSSHWRNRNGIIPARALDDFRSLAAIVEWVGKRG